MDPTRELPAVIPEEPLARIPGIEVDRVLGRGGMGLVLHGRQTLLRREVAVKVLKPGEKVSAEFEDRFRREAQILAGVQHPNIVSCYHADTLENGSCYIVMEFVRGPNLREWIGKHGPADPALALEVCRSLARALDHAYRHKIIHRDIKPENVLLEPLDEPTGRFPFEVKLADLGLARYADGEHTLLTNPGAVMGTPATMAPEQYLAPESVDFKADIYGLGCVLFYMLTGRHAFTQPSIAQILDAKKEAPLGPDPSETSVGTPAPVVRLVRRMMARDPGERPASYDDLIATCSELLHAPTGALPVGNRRRVQRIPIAAAVIGASVLVGSGLWMFGGREDSVEGALARTTGAEGVPSRDFVTWVEIRSHRTKYKYGERVRLESQLAPGAELGATFEWKVVEEEGTPEVDLGPANGPVLEFEAPVLEREGYLVVRLTVTRPGKKEGRCEYRIQLHPNHPPKPRAGEPRSVLAGQRVELQGEAQDVDLADTKLNYEWELVRGRGVIPETRAPNIVFTAPKYEPRGLNELEFALRVDDGELQAEARTTVQILPLPLRRGERRELFAQELPASADWNYKDAVGQWGSFSEREESEIERGLGSSGFGDECSIEYLALPGGSWRLTGSLWLVNEYDEMCTFGGVRFDSGEKGVEFMVRQEGDCFVSRIAGVERNQAGSFDVTVVGDVAGKVDDGGAEHVDFTITWNDKMLEFEWDGEHRETVPLESRPEVLTLVARGTGRVAFDRFVLLGQ